MRNGLRAFPTPPSSVSLCGVTQLTEFPECTPLALTGAGPRCLFTVTHCESGGSNKTLALRTHTALSPVDPSCERTDRVVRSRLRKALCVGTKTAEKR